MIFSSLVIFIPLGMGYVLPFPRSLSHVIDKLCHHLVHAILLLMGINLMQMENIYLYIEEIVGLTLILTLSVAFFTCTLLYGLDKRARIPTKETINTAKSPLPYKHTLIVIGVVMFGGIIGANTQIPAIMIERLSEGLLMVLLLLIGFQLKNSGLPLTKILLNTAGIKIAIITLIGGWLGGLMTAFTLSLPASLGLALGSGFGWYSLTGLLVDEQLGPIYGCAAFLSELIRELLALICIPIFISRFPTTCIGYAGATALDFTLPMIQQHGKTRDAAAAIVSGFLLSLSVPILITSFLTF
jgi:uncharacterized membrane protein YbjE (DUF340 family)